MGSMGLMGAPPLPRLHPFALDGPASRIVVRATVKRVTGPANVLYSPDPRPLIHPKTMRFHLIKAFR